MRDAAGGATAALAAHVRPRNVVAVVPYLLDGMAPACAWQTKVLSAHHTGLLTRQGSAALEGQAPQWELGESGLPCTQRRGGRSRTNAAVHQCRSLTAEVAPCGVVAG